MPPRQAETRLFGAGELGARLNGMTAMVPIWDLERRAPVALEGEEGADRVERPGQNLLRGRPQSAEQTHAAEDSSALRRPAKECCNTLGKSKIPATTYFPRELPPEYLRRWRA